MSLLKLPTEIAEAAKLAGVVYGGPGVGKSTLTLSAPTPVLIDADHGMRRVQKRFQVPCLDLTDYATLLALIESPELDPFETIVIDTTGRLIERIGDHLAADNQTYRQKDGSLSLKGFGRLKVEFQRLLRLIGDHKKHVIFVAHDREERDGDNRIIRPDFGPGASGKELIKDMDFIGYMEMLGNERTISFNPCERFYAKNSFNLPAVIKVPDIKDGNTFIKDYLLVKAHEKMAADDEENHRYVELVTDLKEIVGAVTDAKSADEAVAYIREKPEIWDSHRVARKAFGDRVQELGLVYDRAAKKYSKAKTEKAAELQAAK